jgi:selenocysteine lyase/cysteine desulfurase
VNLAALRSALPLVRRLVYLNAGTAGPLPITALQAAEREFEEECSEGRIGGHIARRHELRERLRAGWAGVLGCDPLRLAFASSTREALARVLDGMRLGRGTEIVTSDQEHPALEVPLRLAAARGARVRAVPLCEVADAVRSETTLVACSHVSWISGECAPSALTEVDVPVVLDGAQAAGAVPVDVRALGCSAYAAPGHKWLCGVEGAAMLYIDLALLQSLPAVTLPPPEIPLAGCGVDDARIHDTGAIARSAAAASLAALELLEETGLASIQRRAISAAATLATRLREQGRRVVERGASTLVAWEEEEPELRCHELEEQGVIVRPVPERSLIRASVGGWASDEDLDRLVNNVSG